MSTDDYPAVRAWGHLMHSGSYFIEEEVARARKDRAPRLAIYSWSRWRGWRTLHNVTNPGTVHFFRTQYPDLAREAWGETDPVR